MDFGSLFSGFGSLTTVLVTTPFVIIALVLLFIGLNQRRKLGTARRTWQSTTGRIVFSQVEARTSSSSEGGTTTSYYPRVVYEYAVSGNRYQGSRVALGGEVGIGSYQAVERKVMEQYPTGGTVQVYYNPNNPREATLEMNTPRATIFLLIAVVIIVILVITTLFMAGGMGFVTNLLDSITNAVGR